jgi:coenzyme F420 hydrogenase subunit beta
LRSIKNIHDIVAWNLCIGCGACYYACDKKAVALINIVTQGIRPKFNYLCKNCNSCLSFCPGYKIEGREFSSDSISNLKNTISIGPTIDVWEGNACDEEIRYQGSSGGILSAIALYCLEKEKMAFVVHTGTDEQKPWINETVQSWNRADILMHTGSRYQASSPCDSLSLIETSDRPCVFIGRPCDTAAVSMLRKIRPKLDANLGLVLTFFCAGTPSLQATLQLLKQLDIPTEQVNELRYRGKGWPGGFSVECKDKSKNKFLSYEKSWGFLNNFRPFRCQLCPDGLGELADISCGDAWHRFINENENSGKSLVLARSHLGKEIILKAIKTGYINLELSDSINVIKAQGLVKRKKQIFGRLLAMKLLVIPFTRFNNFHLFRNWLKLSFIEKLKSIIGTLKRLIFRGLWHRNKIE